MMNCNDMMNFTTTNFTRIDIKLHREISDLTAGYTVSWYLITVRQS